MVIRGKQGVSAEKWKLYFMNTKMEEEEEEILKLTSI